jgi:adenylate cyclase
MSPPTSGRLLLRAQRREGNRVVSKDFSVPLGQPQRLGREPRMAPGQTGFDPEYGSDLVTGPGGDLHVSNFHATLTWDGARLRVQKWPKANNPILLLDRQNPDAFQKLDDFTIGPLDRFRIGNTVFTALPDADPIERTCSEQELRAMAFVDPAPRVEALAALPQIIQSSPDEEQLTSRLLSAVLQGVPRADVAAVVRLDAEGQMTVRAAVGRAGPVPGFLPSRKLVYRAIPSYENVAHVWPEPVGAPTEADTPTAMADNDWAICVRLMGPDDDGLYLTGRLGGESVRTGGRVGPPQLDGDMKFAKLAGDIYSGLRDLRALQQRQAFLTQMLSPAVRQVLAGQRIEIEDVTAPREHRVTVLFCDLRGSVEAAEQGQHDLLGAWGKLSEALDVMTEAIVAQDGVIGDFQGDAAMGFWGWPLAQDDQIERAAKAALTIRKKFAAFAKRKHLLSGFVCGIGVAHGPAVAGKLGASDQAKIGVFGPVVNRAARLEAATKRLGVPILIDEAVAEHLAGQGEGSFCRVRCVARVTPQGLAAPVLIAELLPPEGEPGPNLSETNRKVYEAAMARFLDGDWAGFRQRVGNFPKDGPVEFDRRFIEQHPAGPPADWDGGIPVSK